jgi:hypothetical protein
MKSSEIKLLTTIMSCVLLLAVGCSKFTTDYGKTSGASAYSSINGYGTFREAIKNAGFTDREMNRLTDRLKKSTDLVVWAPQNTNPLNSEAVTWIDSWLKQANRTLVYISPDSGSEVEYWTTTRAMAPAEKRMEYRRRAATSQTQRRQNRFSPRKPPSYQWFTISELSQPETIKGVTGPWAPSDVTTADANTQNNATVGLPATPLEYEVSTVLSPKDDTTRVLLKTNKGTAYVAKITSKQWNGSQIFVISSGSLLSNFGLTQSSNQLLADKIIQEAATAKNSGLRAGFLNNNGSAITVSNANKGAPVASGMELLTVWPISLITMHGIFLGFVICLMLWPIFGRPRKTLHVTSGNFGHHLDAVAALMKRVGGGERYARGKISDYMKRIHGETTGPWILNAPATNADQPLHTLRPSRLSARTDPKVNAGETQPTKSQPNATESPEPLLSSEDKSEPDKSQPDGKELE